MPRVPYQPYPEVAAQDIPQPSFHVDAKPAAFGTTVAAAVEHLGGTMNQVGGELFSRAVALQDMNNETEANNLKAEYDMKSSDLRDQFFLQQGLNAKNGLADFKNSQDQLRQEVRGKASNPAVARMYDGQAIGVMNRALVAGSTHAASEARKANTNSYMTGVDADVDQSQYATDDDWRNRILPSIEERSRRIGNDAGKEDIATRDDIFKNQSRSWSARIKEKARTDLPEAVKLLNEAMDPADPKLHSSDRDSTIARVKTALTTTGAKTYARNSLNTMTDIEGQIGARFPNPRISGLNPDFGRRFLSAIKDYEAETGGTVFFPDGSKNAGVRTSETQAAMKAEYDAAVARGEHPGLVGTAQLSRHVEGRGDAFDVPRSDFRDWLEKNATRYGLTFPYGDRDKVHVQLQRGADGSLPAPYQPSEKQYASWAENGAKRMPGSVNDVDFHDAVRRQTISDYRQQRSEQYDQNRNDHVTIYQELFKQPVKSIDELRTRSPQVSDAIDRLSDSDPKFMQIINNSINRVNHTETPEQAQEFRRLYGMAHSPNPEDVSKFLEEKISDSAKLAEHRKTMMFELQARLNKGVAEADPRITRAMSDTRDIWQSFSTDTNKMDVYRGSLLEGIQQRFRDDKKYPSTDDIRAMGRRLALPGAPAERQTLEEIARTRDPRWPTSAPLNVWQWATQGGPGPRLIDQPVPRAEADKIKEEFAVKENIVPSDTLIKQVYIRNQLRMLRDKGAEK